MAIDCLQPIFLISKYQMPNFIFFLPSRTARLFMHRSTTSAQAISLAAKPNIDLNAKFKEAVNNQMLGKAISNFIDICPAVTKAKQSTI